MFLFRRAATSSRGANRHAGKKRNTNAAEDTQLPSLWAILGKHLQVFFYIDPEFETDPKMDGINNIILSYTFFKVNED